jgi:hypothetical protein
MKTHQAVLKRDSEESGEGAIGRSTFGPLEDDNTATNLPVHLDFVVLSCTIAGGHPSPTLTDRLIYRSTRLNEQRPRFSR